MTHRRKIKRHSLNSLINPEVSTLIGIGLQAAILANHKKPRLLLMEHNLNPTHILRQNLPVNSDSPLINIDSRIGLNHNQLLIHTKRQHILTGWNVIDCGDFGVEGCVRPVNLHERHLGQDKVVRAGVAQLAGFYGEVGAQVGGVVLGVQRETQAALGVVNQNEVVGVHDHDVGEVGALFFEVLGVEAGQ